MPIDEIIVPGDPGHTDHHVALAQGVNVHTADDLAHGLGMELAYAVNETGVSLPLTSTLQAVTGVMFTLEANPRPIWIWAGGTVDVTTAPAAGFSYTPSLHLVNDLEETPGAILHTYPSGSGTSGFQFIGGLVARIAPNTPTRTYRLMANSGTQGAGALLNGAIATAFRTHMVAFQH